MTIPTYLPYFVFGRHRWRRVVTILYGLNRALADAAWPAADRDAGVSRLGRNPHRLARPVDRSGARWASTTWDASAIPTIQYGIALPILIGSLLIWRSETVARIIDAVPQQWLVGVQLYRALGVIFLILYATGKLPEPLRLAGRRRRHRHRPARADRRPRLCAGAARYRGSRAGLERVWHSRSHRRCNDRLHDRTIVSSSLSRFSPTSELMTMLPMVLIPVYLVPLSIVLHLASLAKLHRETVPNGNRGHASFSVRHAVHYRPPCVSPSEDARPLPYSRSDEVSGVAAGCGFEIM